MSETNKCVNCGKELTGDSKFWDPRNNVHTCSLQCANEYIEKVKVEES